MLTQGVCSATLFAAAVQHLVGEPRLAVVIRQWAPLHTTSLAQKPVLPLCVVIFVVVSLVVERHTLGTVNSALAQARRCLYAVAPDPPAAVQQRPEATTVLDHHQRRRHHHTRNTLLPPTAHALHCLTPSPLRSPLLSSRPRLADHGTPISPQTNPASL